LKVKKTIINRSNFQKIGLHVFEAQDLNFIFERLKPILIQQASLGKLASIKLSAVEEMKKTFVQL